MTKLTKSQRALLTRAASEPDGAIDAPEDTKLTQSLIRQGLAILLPAGDAEAAGRLMITNAGRAAFEPDAQRGDAEQAAEPGAAGSAASAASGAAEPTAAEPPPAPTHARKASPDGKLGMLVTLLKRPQGATVEQMSEATGWQIHSVRGAMSGTLKKRFGLAITSEKLDGGRIYRIAGGTAP